MNDERKASIINRMLQLEKERGGNGTSDLLNKNCLIDALNEEIDKMEKNGEHIAKSMRYYREQVHFCQDNHS